MEAEGRAPKPEALGALHWRSEIQQLLYRLRGEGPRESGRPTFSHLGRPVRGGHSANWCCHISYEEAVACAGGGAGDDRR